MAQRTEVTLIDDTDGTPADQQDVCFGLDGAVFHIDLSDDNAAMLREQIGFWAQHARKVPRSASPTSARRRAGAALSASKQDIREWWRNQGNDISDRGRVPKHVQEAYNDAHGLTA